MVKIRLTRIGRRNKPLYTILAIKSRSAMKGHFIEKLGQYDPNAEQELKDVKVERISEWVKKGALVSDSVRTLLKKHKISLAKPA